MVRSYVFFVVYLALLGLLAQWANFLQGEGLTAQRTISSEPVAQAAVTQPVIAEEIVPEKGPVVEAQAPEIIEPLVIEPVSSKGSSGR